MAAARTRLKPARERAGTAAGAACLLAAGLVLLSSPAGAATIKLVSYGVDGKPLDAAGIGRRLARADEKDPDLTRLPLWAVPLADAPPQRVRLAQDKDEVAATWDKGGAARLDLVWPVQEDGYNAVSADNEGHGFADGESILLEEQIARTQYRRFKEGLRRRMTDWQPLYKPSKRAKELADEAKDAMAKAALQSEPAKRSDAYQKALHAVALAWEKLIFEHGLQHSHDERLAKEQRFGLTIDDGVLGRLDDLEWIVEAVRRSGANWVRLVFRPNHPDFAYANLNSFNEYDGVVAELLKANVKIMGCVLDGTQWPKTLTPEAYAERVKNLSLHFRGKIGSWEVGTELNGDWLGGASAPLSTDDARRIYQAGASKLKELDSNLETVATLYAWEETAPDREHALSGWLEKQVKRGFGRDLDIVGLSVQPEENPSGMGFDRSFETVAEALPAQRLMLSSLGYVEKEELRGYWWLAPDDVDGARKDLVILFATASCAMPRSLCGAGFWWQTLDQMLPPGRRKAKDLYKVWRRTLDQLGRKGED